MNDGRIIMEAEAAANDDLNLVRYSVEWHKAVRGFIVKIANERAAKTVEKIAVPGNFDPTINALEINAYTRACADAAAAIRDLS